MQTPEWSPLTLRATNCPAYILAGGRSSRFGSDKARIEVACVEGRVEPLLLALRRRLNQQGHAVEIVADRADRYEDLEVGCLVDHQTGQGPLAGVATALQHREQQQPGWLLLISCDLFVWRSEWFESLAEKANAPQEGLPAPSSQPACDAIAFVSDTTDSERAWEPFPSLLHTRLLPQAVTRLERGQRSLQTLFGASRAVGIQTQDNPQSWTFNTVEQLRAIRQSRMLQM
ncbi:MAG: NTP transferase domain-containing protein [Planctomycetales bacterium]|nr:NTP transferase domain-containing protein [Planctomycetales bacterium]